MAFYHCFAVLPYPSSRSFFLSYFYAGRIGDSMVPVSSWDKDGSLHAGHVTKLALRHWLNYYYLTKPKEKDLLDLMARQTN